MDVRASTAGLTQMQAFHFVGFWEWRLFAEQGTILVSGV